MRGFGALAAVVAAVASAAPAAAQSPSAVAGRWAVTIEGGAPPRVRGELRLRDSAGRLAGTLLLATHDAAPVPLHDLQLADGRLEFLAAYEPGMRFVARLDGGEMRGQAFGGAGEQLQTWSAERIAEQIEFYPALPRFVLRQLVIGPGSELGPIPGQWTAAAAAAGERVDGMPAAYATAAAAARLSPIPPAQIAAAAWPYLLGIARRAETVAANRAALSRIRDDISDGRTALRFEGLFRSSDGGWITDLHDAALDRAGRYGRGASYAAARPGLIAAAWLSPSDTSAVAVPYALYRLSRLRQTDSLEFQLVAERIATAPASARAVAALLDGYRDAALWYQQALTFLLTAEWIRVEDGRTRSPASLLAEFWGRPVEAPPVATTWFGYPQAVPRYGAGPELTGLALVHDNWTARDWSERNGRRRLLTVVQRLGTDSFPPTTIVTDEGPMRLTTVRRHARESMSGFLSPDDAILADPGVAPLVALGTIVHEWQHLEFERARWAAGPGAAPAVLDSAGGSVALRPAHPVIAEGFAEWSTALIMAPIAARHPITGVGEPLKRARLAGAVPDDPHVVGYLLARTLADVLPPREATARLAAASLQPSAVLEDPRVARAWARFGGGAIPATPARSTGLLVPETLFTIDGGWPDVLEVRIHP